jgi:putative ABC transport system permease protein
MVRLTSPAAPARRLPHPFVFGHMDNAATSTRIPDQPTISWGIALTVSWAGLKRRFLRAMITMTGVVLAIAFLAYMLLMDKVNRALVEALKVEFDGAALLNKLLQDAGVDIHSSGSDKLMYMLIGLSLLICLVGIINAMLMSVTERVKEIGTLKCLGALDSFIIKIYFIESAMQGVIGTILGMVIGLLVAVSVCIHHFGGFVMQFFPWTQAGTSLGTTFIIGTIISVVAAIWPAYMAARKQPVDAMRVEE